MLSNVARARLVTPANSWTVSVSTPRELLNLRSDTPKMTRIALGTMLTILTTNKAGALT